MLTHQEEKMNKTISIDSNNAELYARLRVVINSQPADWASHEKTTTHKYTFMMTYYTRNIIFNNLIKSFSIDLSTRNGVSCDPFLFKNTVIFFDVYTYQPDQYFTRIIYHCETYVILFFTYLIRPTSIYVYILLRRRKTNRVYRLKYIVIGIYRGRLLPRWTCNLMIL